MSIMYIPHMGFVAHDYCIIYVFVAPESQLQVQSLQL